MASISVDVNCSEVRAIMKKDYRVSNHPMIAPIAITPAAGLSLMAAILTSVFSGIRMGIGNVIEFPQF